MSHFSVVVCIDDPDRLDEVMEPFSEQRELPPYRSYEDGAATSYWAVKTLREEAGLNPDDATLTWAQVAEASNRHWGEDEEKLLVAEDGRAYRMSTYNPESKWDYWRIGGRWAGYFPYREGARRRVMLPKLDRWDSPEKIGPDHCDGGRKRDLDLDALRTGKADEARKRYARWHEVIAGTPDALPWSSFTENISEGNGYTINQARDEYHAQPRVQAYKADEEFQWMDDPIAEFAVPEALYVEREGRARAVPGYALVTTDGRWMAPGRMGWFGVSSDSEGDRIGYWETANAYIDALADDVWLIALDCHI